MAEINAVPVASSVDATVADAATDRVWLHNLVAKWSSESPPPFLPRLVLTTDGASLTAAELAAAGVWREPVEATTRWEFAIEWRPEDGPPPSTHHHQTIHAGAEEPRIVSVCTLRPGAPLSDLDALLPTLRVLDSARLVGDAIPLSMRPLLDAQVAALREKANCGLKEATHRYVGSSWCDNSSFAAYLYMPIDFAQRCAHVAFAMALSCDVTKTRAAGLTPTHASGSSS